MVEIVNFDLIIDSKIEQLGGLVEDKYHIMRYLNNNIFKYLKSINSSDGLDYVFEVLGSDINKIEYNSSKCIASGVYSTAIGIKLLLPEDKKYVYPQTLVLKVTGVNKIKRGIEMHESFFDDWNRRNIGIYKFLKKNFGKSFQTMYFWGNQIYDDITGFKNTEKNTEDIKDDDEKKSTFVNFIREKRLSFSITRYYDDIKEKSFMEKQLFIIKNISVLNYISNLGYLIGDYKLDNVRTDDLCNLVCIDYAYNTFFSFKKGELYILGEYINFGGLIPCFIIKKIYNVMRYEIDNIDNLMKHRVEYIKNQPTEPNSLFNTFFNKYNDIKEKLKIDYLDRNLDERFAGSKLVDKVIKTNLKNDYDIGLEKFDVIGLVDIIFKLFFMSFIGDNNLKSITAFSMSKKINNGDIEFELNSSNNSAKLKIIRRYRAFANLNDISLIQKLIYEFIQPLNDEHAPFCELLKPLLFDVESETGLLAPEYLDIPTYDIAFKYLVDKIQLMSKYQDKTLQELYDILLRENIKDSIRPNTLTEQTYEEWRQERLRKKTEGVREYTKYYTPELPPVNTKFSTYYSNQRRIVPVSVPVPAPAPAPTPVLKQSLESKPDEGWTVVSKKSSKKSPPQQRLERPIRAIGGYKEKYMKYKQKYLNLKKLLETQ
jgi:hypothetical protein